MGHEIERKFLLRGDAWRSAPYKQFKQGYLASDEGVTVRVRVTEDRAFLTIKGRTQGIIRPEYEYDIPVKDAEEMLEKLCHQPIITKHRHEIEYEGHTWEVDEFFGANEGLIIAEIELDSEDAEYSLPDWIGAEVTGDKRFYNSFLVSHPFSKWTEAERNFCRS